MKNISYLRKSPQKIDDEPLRRYMLTHMHHRKYVPFLDTSKHQEVTVKHRLVCFHMHLYYSTEKINHLQGCHLLILEIHRMVF